MQKLLVITSYPEKGQVHSNKTVGVASYSKLLFKGVSENTDLKIKVLAEKNSGKAKYKEGKIEVERIWNRNDLSSILRLFQKVLVSDYKNVLLSFEIGLFGNLIATLIGILGFLILRISGKKTYVLLHQVATNFDGFENPVKGTFLNFISKVFYFLVKLSATKIFVFEQILKEKLGGGTKVKVLPHLIPEVQEINKSLAKKRLGLKENKTYGLYFGYIAPYKGIDWLVENWPTNESELIVAGGINPNYKNDPKLNKLFQNVSIKASEKGIKMSGFVVERDIKLYFSACDFVVLPYKMFFSSSGPLALAFAYKKPVLLSETLKDYTKTNDVKLALKESGLIQKDLVFNFNQKSLELSIKNVLSKKAKYEKFAKSINVSRNIRRISNLFFSLISNN